MVGTCVRRLRGMLALSVLVVAATVGRAHAQIGSDRYAAMVVEAQSGTVLMAASADQPRYPASLTKIMTLYMAFEALRDGRITLSTPIRVSSSAAAMPPSRLGLTAGMTLTVEEAILALVTKSANDAAAALGEFLGGGSEERFAQMMTLKARSLGMSHTTFRNASGLPDLDQVSTARDMVTLGRRVMQDFPREYAYFSTPHFVFRGRTHWNHNRLLQEYEGTDGIKTGYVNDSGFNLLASVERDGVRLVAAVFGGRTSRERDRHMMALLDQGFAQMGIAPVARRSVPVLVSTAQAASRPQARAARSVRSTRAAARPAARRVSTAASARRPTAARARTVRVAHAAPRAIRGVEQGDTSRTSQPATVRHRSPAAGKASARATKRTTAAARTTTREARNSGTRRASN